MLSDADKVLLKILGTISEKNRYLRHVMVLDTKGNCVKHVKDINNKSDAAMPVIEYLNSISKNAKGKK